MKTEFVEALVSENRNVNMQEEMDWFGALIGDWDMDDLCEKDDKKESTNNREVPAAAGSIKEGHDGFLSLKVFR